MSTMEILFLVFTIPSAYLIGMILSYKLYRKFIFNDDSEIDDARACAVLWIATLPFFILVGGGWSIIHSIFDMIDGGNNDNNH